MWNKRTKQRVLFVLKITLSVVAILYVFKRVSFGEIISVLRSSREIFIIIAFVLFIASKYISARRTLLILHAYDIRMPEWENLKLYWAGMFYNLFLPGGIGGDIYKTVVINKMHGSGLKISAGSVLIDRIAGVAALMILALACIPFTGLSAGYGWLTLAGIPVILVSLSGGIMLLMPRLKPIIGKLILGSFMVQVIQMLSVYFILISFGIFSEQISYLLIFLISSVAAMLPISVGGIGIREMVFLETSRYMALDQQVAVTVSFTFYLITAIASLIGIFAILENRNRNEPEVKTTIKP